MRRRCDHVICSSYLVTIPSCDDACKTQTCDFFAKSEAVMTMRNGSTQRLGIYEQKERTKVWPTIRCESANNAVRRDGGIGYRRGLFRTIGSHGQETRRWQT